MKNNKSRKTIPERDLKMLWGKAGNRCAICRKELVHDRINSDPDVVVGIAAHIIADSPDGPRGSSDLSLDKRHLYNNLILLCMRDSKVIDEQLETYTIDKLNNMKKNHETWVSKKLSSDDIVEGKDLVPVLDVLLPIGYTGGSQGHFHSFSFKNISKETAIDFKWGIRGFGYEWLAPKSVNKQTFSPGDELKDLEFPLSSQDLYTNEIPELYIFMEYKNINGKLFLTRRDLTQQKVPSGAFYVLDVGDFHPATSIMVDNSIISISELYNISQTLLVGCYFEVNLNGETKVITISLGPISIKAWGLSDSQRIRTAIIELGTKLIQKMIKEDRLEDHTIGYEDFDLSKITNGGFEGYKEARDSL